MENFFDTRRILKIVWKWKVHFLIIGVIAFALAALFSSPYFIKPKFQSFARLYPVNISTYSNESESEQMLEVANSMDIKRRMFEAFDLGNYYGIKEDDPHYMSKLIRDYKENVKIKKTEYETVEIRVLDWDAERASNMVDSIVKFYNEKLQRVQSDLNYGLANAAFEALTERKKEIAGVNEKLNKIRQENDILDYEMQVKEFSKGYAEALAAGNNTAAKKIKEMLDNFSLKGGEFESLKSEIEGLQVQADTLSVRYNKAMEKATQKISYTQIIESPFPSDKKSYPVRWIIVLLTLFAAEVMALLIILVIEDNKRA